MFIHLPGLGAPQLPVARARAAYPELHILLHVVATQDRPGVFIDRLYDQNVGYCQSDLQGLDHLTAADRAELLVDYLGLSEGQLLKAVDHLVADGKYELAASLIESSARRFEHNAAVGSAERLVNLKLIAKNQNMDPFEFIIDSAKIGEQLRRWLQAGEVPRILELPPVSFQAVIGISSGSGTGRLHSAGYSP